MNPTQKAGNSKMRRRRVRTRKGDRHIKAIARIEAKKAVAKKVESKVFDYSVLAATVDWSASTTIFNITNGIVRGTGENDFIGDSLMPTHIRIKWACVCKDNTNLLRVVVIQNKAGGVPLGATLFQTSGSVNTPLSPYDSSYSKTYRVLFDEFYSMVGSVDDPPTMTGTSQITGDIRILSKKLRPISFNTAGAVTTGDIWLIFVSDSGLPANPIVQFFSRLYYKDA